MGNFFSDEIDKSDPRWLLNQDSSKRISQQMAKTMMTVHQQYKRELSGDKEKAYCCMLRDFDKLLIETVPTLKGRAHFETRKNMLSRNLPKGEIKDFMLKATVEKIHTAAEIQLDIDFFKIITLWFENDEDMSGTLDLEEMSHLMRNLGLELSDEDLKKRMIMYQSDGSSKSVKLTFPDLFAMYMDMTTIRAIADIFKAGKTTPSDLMDVTDLVRFLRSSQKIHFERDESYRIIEALFRDVKKDKGFEGITYRQFQGYLLDYQTNGWYDSAHRYVWQDMSQPLTHYFINSSHNTYCTLGQLKGESDPAMYTKVLREGCRCVEIDCWPGNGDPRGPRVTHGGTLMTSCWFKDVCIAINEAAFEVSPYPVILSLELHVGDVEQTLMVEIMRSIFGEQLLTAKEIESMEFGGKEFTPIGLIRKILVKCKKEKSDSDGESDDDDDGAGNMSGADNLTMEERQQELQIKHARKSAANNRLAAVSTVQAHALPRDKRGNIKTCINLLRACKHYNIVSISEDSFSKWMKFTAAAVATTQSTLIRTYPKGRRVDSSNYNPIDAWELGSQCVALNLQTHDIHYYINRALFKTNGDSGYVLKPQWMREQPRLANVKDDGSVTQLSQNAPTSKSEQQQQQYELARAMPIVERIKENATLRIRVICAQNISNPASTSDAVSPVISLTLVGPKYKEFRQTKTIIRNNGFDPHWLEVFEFNRITSIDMSFLYIAVSTKSSGLKVNDTLLGENAINLGALRCGYRAVPFFNAVPNARVRKIAVLLCHFELQRHATIDPIDI